MVSTEIIPYRVRAFQVPKDGQDPEGCEDAFRLRGLPTSWDGALTSLPVRRLRAAVTDGATQSSFARLWARLIASAAVNTGAPLSKCNSLMRQLSRLARVWRQDAERTLPPVRPWYVEDGLDRGAHSSLLSLNISGGRWQAVAIGDTCLFQIRDGAVLQAFPLERPEDFDQRPWLLSSIPDKNRGLAARIRTAEGRARSGDTFLLATDALSRWFLASGGWRKVLRLCDASCDHQAFADLVDEERHAGQLEDDDSTLLVARIP